MAAVCREARLLLHGIAVGAILMAENDGALRFYMIGSIFLSMLAYDRIISRNLRKVLKMVLRCIRMKLHR